MNRESPTLQSTPDERSQAAAREHARLGGIYGAAAYVWWGLSPIYFKVVASVPPLQVLSHRIVWSLGFLVVLLALQRRWREVRRTIKDRRTLGRLCITTVLIANNWGVFIWSVANDMLVEASFGYFIGPLVYVMLGRIFLGERLRGMQAASIVLAVIGVGYLIVAHGAVPWVALVLAFSFAFYGLIRKTTNAAALTGLTVETALLALPALGFLLYEDLRGVGCFARMSWQMDVLLSLAGIVTAVPLLWFAAAAPRVRLATLGILQYLAPTGQFLLGVLAYGEPFSPERQVSFALIWIALLIYTIDAYLASTRAKRLVA